MPNHPAPKIRNFLGWRIASLMFLGLGIAPAAGGPAINQFELKDLESAPGYRQFQSQNAWSSGQPSREAAVNGAGEQVFDDNSVARQREALEMEMGLAAWLKFRIGIEFEEERLDDPLSMSEVNDFESLKLTEMGGEIIAVLVPRKGNGFGLGFVTEVERPLQRGEQMQLNTGPIIEWASGAWSATLVPTVVQYFGGDPNEEGQRDNKRDFAYAVQAMYTTSPAWAFALEAYGTLDRIGDSGNATASQGLFGEHDQHRIGPVIYITRPVTTLSAGAIESRQAGNLEKMESDDDGSTMTVGLGYFAGLNSATPSSTLKLSVELDF